MPRSLLGVMFVLLASTVARGQEPAAQDHLLHTMPTSWTFMHDGVVFMTSSHQTGPRGGDELVSTDWFMGTATRQAGPGRLTLTGMVSFERATTGPRGYRELFQVGETFHFIPLVDRQHPHDLLMQASAAWRLPLTPATGITFVGAPVGEATLGPVPFMHRPSAAESPVAPLGHHHRFDPHRDGRHRGRHRSRPVAV